MTPGLIINYESFADSLGLFLNSTYNLNNPFLLIYFFYVTWLPLLCNAYPTL